MTRDLLLRETALAGARAWMNGWLRTLAEEGRPVEGGWPGTLGEARARARHDATRALAREAMTAPSRDELEDLARLINDEARRLWRASI